MIREYHYVFIEAFSDRLDYSPDGGYQPKYSGKVKTKRN